MKINLILSVTLLVIASAAPVSAAPTLKANPNPIVVAAGQNPPSGGATASRRKFTFPFIINVQVVPRASFVDISYSTLQPAGALIEISTQRPLAAVADLPDVIPAGQKVPPAFPPDSALATFSISSDKVKQRTARMRELQPNTTYYYVITTGAPDGRTHRYWDKFRTIDRVVKIVFERVLILSNAFAGSGNAWSFNFAANDSWLSEPDGWLLSYPGNSNSVLLANNQWADVNVQTTIGAAPGSLSLSVFAFAKAPYLLNFGIPKTKDDPRPQRQDKGSTRDTAWATASDGIDTSANYTDQPGTYPFKLAAGTGSGSLMLFEVQGRLEVSYSDEKDNTGASSSAQPPKPIVKAIGRVKVTPPTGTPPRSICDVAREARARNSPAAPGLEAQCRAAGEAPAVDVDDLAARGESIANADPIVAEARTAETDVLYRQGFDIATGIFGDPALGAQGNTAVGPGSLSIRDSLSAAGQRGFNASVKLHLSRNYER